MGKESEAFDLMAWDELRMLDPGLVTIGCHSMTHPILPTLDGHELAPDSDPYLLPRIYYAVNVAQLAWRMHRPRA